MADQSNIEPKEKSLKIDEDGKLTRKYDLVEQMKFLYISIVRARNLPESHEFYVDIKIGNLKASTLVFAQNSPFEWNQVFAIEEDKIQDTNIEVLVKDKMDALDRPHAFFGRVQFNISEIQARFSGAFVRITMGPKLVTSQTETLPIKGDIMLSLWMGTQADEHFPNAWCSNAIGITRDAIGYTRSKVYISPTLWYLKVNVIQAEDLILRLDLKSSELFVQVDLGGQHLRTQYSKEKSAKPLWNENLMFVAQEPWNDTLVLSVLQGTVEEHVSLGRVELHLKDVAKVLDGAGTDAQFYDLNITGVIPENVPRDQFTSKLNARIYLDGAYHVMDEPIEYSSDFNPSSRGLWKPSIGVLELGILKASGLVPMKAETRTTDAYCVAKYGSKWVRTRTIVNSLEPKWNEQYMWEVYEPFTVITIAIFDNNQLDANRRVRGVSRDGLRVIDSPLGASDAAIGKIRIKLSTLERDKVYTHSYPIISLQPSGIKKMGEIHLAVRFCMTFLSSLKMCQLYMQPLLPLNHYFCPLAPAQDDYLRNQAAHVIAQRLRRAEPSLRREVVYYMLDVRSNIWSLRKARVNLARLTSLIGDFVSFWKWLEDICHWKNPIATILFNFVCIFVVLYPQPLLPLVSFYVLWIGLKGYYKRPSHFCHIDTKLSGAYIVSPEDFEEELDAYPTQLEGELLRRRYYKLRFIGSGVQKIASDLATIGERLQSLSNWRDPRATIIFLLFCVIGFVVTVTIRFRVVIIIGITFFLRHPRFRSGSPSIPQNLLCRMPSKQAFIL